MHKCCIPGLGRGKKEPPNPPAISKIILTPAGDVKPQDGALSGKGKERAKAKAESREAFPKKQPGFGKIGKG